MDGQHDRDSHRLAIYASSRFVWSYWRMLFGLAITEATEAAQLRYEGFAA